VSAERTIIGRERELEALTGALDAAKGGRGSTRLVSGEPGIGKSSLVTRLAEEASARDLSVVWGRSWESGGAPAFWPWIEAIRDLVAARSPEEARGALGAGAGVVAGLVPELAQLGPFDAPPPLEARQAQFRLFDAVASFLGRASSQGPLLIVLEDLHAAEPASIALLDFVARTITRHALLVVGTYRVAEAKRAGLLDALARPGRLAETLHLAPLDRAAVARIVEAVTGDASEELVDKVASTSEGNPLFAVELARLLASRRGDTEGEVVLPAQITAVITERALGLAPETAATLRRLSVLGRELSITDALAFEDEDASELEALLSPAIDAGLIAKPDASTYRFTHSLVREALHQALSPRERAGLHFRVAEALRERHARDPEPPLSRIAHHYVEAGAQAGDAAVDFKVRAADRALAVLAHEEAAELYSDALQALERLEPGDGTRRCALLLSLGHALLRAGEIERGEDACRQAARLARKLGSDTLFARAALEYGSKFTFGLVDPELVSLLEEALELLGAEHVALRAQVLARLAAAKQPSLDPNPPMEMAREAIALAREHGDERTFLVVVRSACSALMDYADPRERVALNSEYVDLARRLDEPGEVLRGYSRLLFDHLELGDTLEATKIVDLYARIADTLDHPSYLWVAHAFRALLALMSGRFDEAREQRERAKAFGEQSGDGNASIGLFMQKLAQDRLSFDDEALSHYVDFDFTVGNLTAIRVCRATFLLMGGKRDLLAEEIKGMETEQWADSADPHLLSFAAEVAVGMEDEVLARVLYDSLASQGDGNVSWGMVGLHCDGPFEHWLAMLAWTFGEHEEASRRFERAVEGAWKLRAPPIAARSLYEHGRRLLARARVEERARGRALLDEALEIAREHGIDGLVRRIEALADDSPKPAPATAPATAPAFVREGDVWAITFMQDTVRVKNTKGLEILAKLVAEPDREFHVVDLAGAGPVVEESSTGEVIDARAREAYKKRALELRAELEEATEWNDTGRVQRARAELEALEAELRGALGLGGRTRETGATAERARTNVQKRIRVAQKKIAAHHPALAEHLDRTVRTGVFCVYSPLPA
jgi:tetratricopeptide (TPR) repeat protein